MRHLLLFAIAAGATIHPARAQEGLKPQFHGFATQGFIYTGGNNYLGMNTNAGSLGWTEAAVNVNDQLTGELRVGVQFHYTRLGAFGASKIGLDWALADYKFKRWIGVRAGKVKIRWGLYNDVQDADPGYMVSLLPEPIYAVDWRATNLSQLGAEVYGSVPLPKRLGGIDYSVYYGNYWYNKHDGYMETFRQSGLYFANQPGGKTPGFDLRWRTPVRGLTLGGSLMAYDAKGNLVNGSFRQPLTYWPTYYAQYDRKRFFASWQYMKLVQYNDVAADGGPETSSLSDTRAWFAMFGYHLTDKLQVGTYHTRYVVASAADRTDPSNYYRDWALSCRYDINSYFYLKLEDHLIQGTGGGFYAFDNPDGLRPRTNAVVAKVGFSF